ncbi:aldehyde dehydrogenase family protein [Novosphingobium sp. PASSN1]|uniref:aldehyde dehydrogenase family protein n=1 Tax=Novosphingobium sp. PASSN1 TaxID=2015561 RepID=UPI000BDC44A9|nr:aldehyde dehydrogenase family protein [Novosphingobium sp. PASSN1]OYU34757.1 MAG: aldehyde dehydrogenase [Novosphingobium sp. PASSN1]
MFTLSHPRSVYIRGEWVEVSETAPVINPATEEVICEAAVSGLDHAAAAVGAAREAFDLGPWPKMKQSERNAILSAFLDAIEARREDVIQLMIAESGATRQGCEYFGYGTALYLGRGYLDLANRPAITPLPIESVPSHDGRINLAVGNMVREPAGVVVAITAYNAPLMLNVAKIIPAMAVGCTVVLKPSPFTPIEALMLGEFAEQAGIPAGVLNIVTGDVAVGEALTTDRRVDLISFTGSDKVGSIIMQQAAPQLKRVLLELGGKSAMIVRPDADLDAAAMAGLYGFIFQCGQGCGLHTRHIVHNSVRKAYVEKVAAMLGHVSIGDPSDPATAVGPLINAQARQRSEAYVTLGLEQGGRLVAGGQRPAGLGRGFFFEPTLFDDVQNSSRIAQEEIFGPIGVVIGYDTDEEAIKIANDSDYGLSGGIFSTDIGRAHEMALAMRTGNVLLNGGPGVFSPYHPYGGYKRSGIGREYGIEGLNEFTQVKTILFKGA